jgi:hypothetical protein
VLQQNRTLHFFIYYNRIEIFISHSRIEQDERGKSWEKGVTVKGGEGIRRWCYERQRTKSGED